MSSLFDVRLSAAKRQLQDAEEARLAEEIARQLEIEDAEKERAAAAERARIEQARARMEPRLQAATVKVADLAVQFLDAHSELASLYEEARVGGLALQGHLLLAAVEWLKSTLDAFVSESAREGRMDPKRNAVQKRLDEAALLKRPGPDPRHRKGAVIDDAAFVGPVSAMYRAARAQIVASAFEART